MGLCKCPKKKVTNLFCFEHRVNVCEHCLVANHQKCIVQSYLQWLQDSDYDPTCRLCGKNLCDDSGLECVRLMCHDVYHWKCLDQYCRKLPANTAPAGYTCPICRSEIFPATNIASPVADKLKQQLSTVNWARAGLSMPLIDEPEQAPPTSHNTSSYDIANDTQQGFIGASFDPMTSSSSHIPGTHAPVAAQLHDTHAHSGAHSKNTAGNSVDDAMAYSRGEKQLDIFQNARKVFDSTREDHTLNMTHDHDDDKYKRRSAFHWLSRWFKSRTGGANQRRDPHARTKRIVLIVLLAIIALMTLIVIFSRLGRASADNDPFLDPMANPNIRVGDE